MNSNSLAKILGYASPEKISRLFRDNKAKAKPSYSILFDIANKFDDLNVEWLITGRGDMLKTEGLSEQVVNDPLSSYVFEVKEFLTPVGKNKEPHVYYISHEEQKKYVKHYHDFAYLQSLPTYQLPNLPGKFFRLFEAGETNMQPFITQGDIVIARFVENEKELRENQVYVFFPEKGKVQMKKLSKKENNQLVFSSIQNGNQQNQDAPVSLDKIHELWIVKGYIRNTMNLSEDLQDKISRLESRMSEIEKKMNP